MLQNRRRGGAASTGVPRAAHDRWMVMASDSTLQIRPGVAAIVRDAAGRVLLHRRRVGGGWAPPSGAVEPGETVAAALHRELSEETALAVADARLVAIYSDPAYQ